MNGTRTMLGLVLAGALLPLAAQEYDLKVRTGLTAGTLAERLHDNKMLGLALSGTYPLGNGAALVAELGYDYLPGRGKDALPASGSAVYFRQADGTVVSTAPGGQPLFLQIGKTNGSLQQTLRKMEGFSLRASYQARLPWMEKMTWHAGLSLDRMKSRNQSMGNIVPVYKDASGAVKNLGVNAYEGWALLEERSTVQIGVHAGLGYQLHENHRLEVVVRNVGQGLREYTPLATTGKKAESRDLNGRGFVFEVGLTVKL